MKTPAASRLLFIVGLVLTVFVLPLEGVASPGGISGTVTEASTGKPVIGAEVRVIANEGASRGGAALAEIIAVEDSDTAGRFQATGIDGGTYTVVVTHPEYKSTVQKDVQVSGAQSTTLDLSLTAKNRY